KHVPMSSASLQTRCYQNPISQEELVIHSLIPLMGKDVFHRAHYGLACQSGLTRQRQDISLVFLPHLYGLQDCPEMRSVQDSPRGDGELHHWHERMALG